LSGGLSSRLREIRDELIDPLAHLEAHIDFPDEDIAPDTRIEMGLKLDRALCKIDALLKTSREGQILRNGIRTVIVGRPNSGKSSLLNRLLGQDRAIVSPIPGTTRDTIEEVANIRGLPILFVDTAGLRIAESEIEEEGIRRTREVRDRAELILHVFDGSESLTDEDVKLLDESQDKPSIIVWNKIDLSHRAKLPSDINAPLVEISCLTGQGIEALKDAIKDVVWSGAIEAEAVDATINARHQEALRRAREGTLLAKGSLDRVESMEFVAMELRIAIGALGEITGQTTTEDLLDQIFSRFCIGK
ncbi:MAG: tRNA modification GTPase, partial [Verrucomicrobiota bacterium]